MDPEKKQKMAENGYQYDKDLLCFISRENGKIFSDAWVEDKNINTIQISLNIPHQPTMWKLFLNPEQPHEEIRHALLEKYGKIP